MLLLGIDSGTQSTRTMVFDADSGKTLASAHQTYGLIEGLPPGHLEQEPQTWIDAVESTVRQCLTVIGARRKEVGAIGVSGQQHGLVALDRKGRPLRPAKLWCDTSTAAQCKAFETEFGGADDLIELAGNPILPGYTAPKLLWMKQEEPKKFARLATVQLPHDYINYWLTGELRMEYGDASGTGLLDIRTRKWCEPLVKFIDERLPECLPSPVSSRQPVGLLRESLRTAWGLGASTIVSAGGGDNMMGAIGTGNVRPGIVTASLGTSGTLYSCAAEPVVDPAGEVAAFCDSADCWLPLVCTMNVTVATEQIRSLFGWDHARLEEAVAAEPAGARGLTFLPYLNGERTPNLPGGSGVFHGLTTSNMNPATMARAVMEGATLGLAYGLGRLQALGVEPKEIRLTGGGSKSAVWCQMCADVFGVPIVCPESAEAASLGAGIQALWNHATVNGDTTSLETLTDRLVKLDDSSRLTPRKDETAIYAELLGRQTDLSRRLARGGYL